MNIRGVSFFVFAAYLLKSHLILAEDDDPTRGISITTSEPELEHSQFNKRDSRGQTTYNTNLPESRLKSSNDEPFRPMYRPFYLKDQATVKYDNNQIAPSQQTAEIYYDPSPQTRKSEAPKPAVTAPQTTASLQSHSNIPLAGSFLSSGGGALREQYNALVYQRESQRLSPQTGSNFKDNSNPEKDKQQHTFTYQEATAPDPKPYYQPQQTNFVLPAQHYQSRQHPSYYTQPFAQPSTAPTAPQQHIQYIIAIPLSQLRQLQQQQQQYAPDAFKTTQHTVDQHPKEFFNGYSSFQNANYQEGSKEPKIAQQQPLQYTTQYIQLPNSVLHAAVQAAHNYQTQPQPQQVHDHLQSPSNSYVQPNFVYYPQTTEQSEQQYSEYSQSANLATNPDKSSDDVNYAGSVKSKPQVEAAQPKEVRILPTPLPQHKPLSHAPVAPWVNPAPVVHYNPVYVQAPPQEQQSLFGRVNYHRFTTGGFAASTPVPFLRLSHAPQTYSPYYTPLPLPHHHHHHLAQPPIQPFYRTYFPQRPSSHGLPYFTHPGGIHYGTHLYHPPTSNFVTPPPASSKNAEPASEKQQQPSNQPQYTSGTHHATAATEPSNLVKYP